MISEALLFWSYAPTPAVALPESPVPGVPAACRDELSKLLAEGTHPITGPARAMALIASADAEFAQVWFHAGKVTVFVDDAVHEFFQIPRDLPFPVENLREKTRGRIVQSATFDAEQLHRIQKALGTDHVALRQADKHLLSVWPRGDDQARSCGFLATFGDREGS